MSANTDPQFPSNIDLTTTNNNASMTTASMATIMASKRLQELENNGLLPSSPIIARRALAQSLGTKAVGQKQAPKKSSRVPDDNSVRIDIEEEKKENEKKHPRVLAQEILQSRSNSPAAATGSEFPTPVARKRQISDPSPVHDSNGVINARLTNMYRGLPGTIEFKTPQPLSTMNLWTEEIVKRFMEFSDICKQSAINWSV